jgi:hypothetical protein
MSGSDLLSRKTVTATETFIINEFLHEIGNDSDGAPDSAWQHLIAKLQKLSNYWNPVTLQMYFKSHKIRVPPPRLP